MSWKDNAIMFWNGNKVTDHNRKPLSSSIIRIGTDKRMFDGTLRRQVSGRKRRTWDIGWENLVSTNDSVGAIKTVDGGWSGKEIEEFYHSTDGSFRMILRNGNAVGLAAPTPAESALPYEDDNFYITNVMFTSFSKEITRRGPNIDLWTISISLEEV